MMEKQSGAGFHKTYRPTRGNPTGGRRCAWRSKEGACGSLGVGCEGQPGRELDLNLAKMVRQGLLGEMMQF